MKPSAQIAQPGLRSESFQETSKNRPTIAWGAWKLVSSDVTFWLSMSWPQKLPLQKRKLHVTTKGLSLLVEVVDLRRKILVSLVIVVLCTRKCSKQWTWWTIANQRVLLPALLLLRMEECFNCLALFIGSRVPWLSNWHEPQQPQFGAACVQRVIFHLFPARRILSCTTGLWKPSVRLLHQCQLISERLWAWKSKRRSNLAADGCRWLQMAVAFCPWVPAWSKARETTDDHDYWRLLVWCHDVNLRLLTCFHPIYKWLTIIYDYC